MSATVRALQARKAEAVDKMAALSAVAEAEDRNLTEAEQTEFATLEASVKGLNARIDREQSVALAQAGLNAANQPVPPAAGTTLTLRPGTKIENDGPNADNDPKGGFKSFGEYAQAVVFAGMKGGAARFDDRLRAAAPTTVGNEGTGADGGFVVPPAYSTDVFQLSLGEDAFLPMTDNTEVQSNSMVFPKTEQTPWGSNGVRAYWQSEATAGTQTKVVLGTQALRLHKLMALVPLSDELASDTNALDTLVPGLIADSIRWKTNEAILNGNGNGQPMGALNSNGPAVQVAKDSGQAANTVSSLNLFNMVSRMTPGSYQRAVWLIHPTVIPLLGTMVLGNIPVFVPAAPPTSGAMTTTPNFGFILGRPVMISQHCATLSGVGDVQLHDFKFYRTITKPGGVQMAQSLHLYFDADAVALRATYRVDGGPKIAAAVSPANGSATLSPFLKLQNR